MRLGGLASRLLAILLIAAALAATAWSSDAPEPGGTRWSLQPSLSWDDNGDLDLHLRTPSTEVAFDNLSADGFALNYDAHPGCAADPLPPEIIAGTSSGGAGTYQVFHVLYSDCEGDPPRVFTATGTAVDPILVDGVLKNPGDTFTIADGVPFTIAAVGSPPPIDDAVFVSQSVPATMAPGRTYDVSVTMRNTGTTTWTADDRGLRPAHSRIHGDHREVVRRGARGLHGKEVLDLDTP